MTTCTNARSRILEYMDKRGVDILDERLDLAVKVSYSDLIPVSGSAHIANNRIAKRAMVNLKFFLSSFRSI